MSQVDYGKALRVARAARGMSQKDLGEAAKLSPSYVSLIEAGKRKPNPDALELLGKALWLPAWALVYLGTTPANHIVAGEVMRMLD